MLSLSYQQFHHTYNALPNISFPIANNHSIIEYELLPQVVTLGIFWYGAAVTGCPLMS